MKKAICKPELGKPVRRTPKVKVIPYGGKPFGLGAHGPEVLYMCLMLQKKGSSIKLTDKFHIGMRSAVISFQQKNKLKATGVVDKKTWDKLAK